MNESTPKGAGEALKVLNLLRDLLASVDFDHGGSDLMENYGLAKPLNQLEAILSEPATTEECDICEGLPCVTEAVCASIRNGEPLPSLEPVRSCGLDGCLWPKFQPAERGE